MIKTLLTICLFALAYYTSQAADNHFELGKRYLKLGNTYREAGNFDKAFKYLEQGRIIVEQNKSWEGRYWSAAAYEFMGYYYRDIKKPEEARANIEKSLNIYREIITQKDGSRQANEDVLTSIRSLSSNLANLKSTTVDTTEKRTLNFSNKKLKALPDGLPANISNLNLSDNRFSEYPSAVSGLKNLEYLDMSDNRMKSIDAGINNLTNLHSLDLSNNRLKELPAGLGKLKDLKELNLSNNRLKTLPPDICEIKGLKYLNLKGNKIEIEDIMNLIKCLPQANILFDEYQRIEEEEGGVKGDEDKATEPQPEQEKTDAEKVNMEI